MEDAAASLELKLLYGKDIRAFNFFQKLSIYASVSISSENPDKKLDCAQQQRTPADKEGDGSPEWHHELRFDLKGIEFHDSDDVFLRIDLFHEGAMFGDKHIGDVHIPLRQLMQQPAGVARFVSYQVKGIDGKPNGVLSFSCKINGVGENMGIGPIGSANGIVYHHHHLENQESPATGDPSPVTTLYPTLEGDTAPSAPPLETQYPPPETYYSLPPESYYPHPPETDYSSPQESYYPHPPQPPPPPPVIYPALPQSTPAYGPGYHYHHGPPPPRHPMHHHHSWGHSHHHRPHMGGGWWGPY